MLNRTIVLSLIISACSFVVKRYQTFVRYAKKQPIEAVFLTIYHITEDLYKPDDALLHILGSIGQINIC